MRDYNHWTVFGAPAELLPHADNRVTLAAERDRHGLEIARLDYTQSDNDRANIACAKDTITRLLQDSGAQDILTIDRYAHLIGGARMEATPETASATPATGSGACPASSSPTAARCPRRARRTPH